MSRAGRRTRGPAPQRPALAFRPMPADPAARRPPVCLTIAGSDSGGGAGIQADLKAFAACGAHGAAAITALTAQNTVAVTGVHPVPGPFIVEQVRAVVEDLGVQAVKIGMLGSVATTEAVAAALQHVPAGTPVVVDPVMVAESGARLLDPEAHAALIELIVPRATVITPNLPEGRALVEDPALDGASLAIAIRELGAACVVVTGGHRDEAVDVFHDGSGTTLIPGPRHPDGAAHGSGCTHASALAAHLAHGFTPLESARAARVLAGEAVRNGLRGLGDGAGPVDILDVVARTPTRT